jgi:hypothetical protein
MVSQAGRWIALIERNRHKREPQAVLRTPGAPGRLPTCCLTRLLTGRQSCRGMGVPPRSAICFEYDLVRLGRKLRFVYAAI